MGVALAVVVGVGVGGYFGVDALTNHHDRACTAIGCTSGIFVSMGEVRSYVRDASSVELCVDGACKTTSAEASSVVGDEWAGVARSGASHVVEVLVRSSAGAVIRRARRVVTLRREEPNGHACGPTCYISSLAFDWHRSVLRLSSV